MTDRQVPARQAASMARRAASLSAALALLALAALIRDHQHASSIVTLGVLLLLGLYNAVTCLVRATGWERP